jgi:hypothetical protein
VVVVLFRIDVLLLHIRGVVVLKDKATTAQIARHHRPVRDSYHQGYEGQPSSPPAGMAAKNANGVVKRQQKEECSQQP